MPAKSGVIGRIDMLTRRGFASVAGCAICSVAGFAASEAYAQGSPATTANGVTRKVLSRTDDLPRVTKPSSWT
jgi:hypothetical protein